MSLTIDGKEDKQTRPLDTRKAQMVLPMIDDLLHKHKLALNDLTAITINPGPGSFTGIRVGLTIANTLGYLLKIPVNDNKPGEPIEAVYS